MLEVIEKLLILQDRDRKIARVKEELDRIAPERGSWEHRGATAQEALDVVKRKLMQLETERKKLELDVDAKKQLIEKYSIQQFQTKKNDEYKALSKEIENCKNSIFELENQQLELMEKAEEVSKEVAAATERARETKSQLEGQKADLDTREQTLKRQLADLQSNYDELSSGIDESVLDRYVRIRRQKGPTTVVGIERSVCGGCHMKLPTQIVISCQAQQELVSCPNCGRILYYAKHMDLAVVQ